KALRMMRKLFFIGGTSNLTVSEFYFLTVRKCTTDSKCLAGDLHARSCKVKPGAREPIYGRSSCHRSQGVIPSSSKKNSRPRIASAVVIFQEAGYSSRWPFAK